MPPPSKKTEALTRIRENQRRSRARKREYISELEKKVRDLENGSTVRKLEDENKLLREILSSVGFGAEWIEGRLREGSAASDANQHVELGDCSVDGVLEMGSGKGIVSPALMPDASDSSALADMFDMSFPLPELDFDFFGSDGGLGSAHPALASNNSDEARTTSTCCSQAPNKQLSAETCSPLEELHRLKGSSSESGTTLCTVAYGLVRKHNRKGLDMTEIGIRLWNGFSKGEQDGEGCKVENRLLFGVLESIST